MASLRVLVSAVAASAMALAALAPTSAAQAERKPAEPRNPAIPQRYLDQAIQWAPCSFDATIKQAHPQAPTTNCAKVKVPMDWHNPDAHPDITVAIAYSKATGPVRGLLTSNPGGPSGPGLNLSATLAVSRPQMFRDFDLLGFDPRGFGQSEALRCLATSEEVAALPTTPDYRVRDEQTHRTEIAEARLYAKACASTEFGRFVSTQQTVYDMDFLRALFNHRLLHFVGYSYGTWLGGWYADTYPQRVGRFVLDSNMDWTHSQWDNVNFDPWSYQRRFDTQFKPWVGRHADQITGNLGTTADDVQRTYDAIRGKLGALRQAGKTSVRPHELDFKVLGVIGNDRRFIRALTDILVHDELVKAPSAKVQAGHVERAWARLAPALQAYDTLATIKSRYQIPVTLGAGEVVNLGALGDTVRCNDTAWNKDPRFYTREADRMARQNPWAGYLNGVPLCAFWPYPPQDRKLDLKGVPRMLMVHSELDPQTAYEGALRTYKDVSHAARLVSVDDEGQHGEYILGPSSCVQQFGDRFLFNGEVPGRNEICGTAPLPEDGSVYEVKGPLDGKAHPLPRSLTAGGGEQNPLLQEIFDQTAERPVKALNR
ncbi:alpha/beta hydrolase [Kibdelosporangium phytohabitans]|uniref:Alpha/beta hydrolase n=1 Tax=Kibdelosporangium phytohabitans TaxID=860235 RepID=A0A0N9HUF2_9PSEU|nr:alpha/beta hydrolase [Kibdelosporangium phytohabitans]ALG07046.1 alpha/beta hydrolase [Kibdelosporangium phytohabitans]MBE1468343.1 pimeloyl-ACP methyl ester carboxylesterase [Kibdelosporangium phytohabitans]